MTDAPKLPLTLAPDGLVGGLRRQDDPAPLEGAVWYCTDAVDDGLVYRFPAGALVGAQWLSADILADGTETVVLVLTLAEGDDGPAFTMNFAVLNQCSARMQIPLSATDMNAWAFGRRGAYLKAHCGGVRVDLAKVDRMTLTVRMKGLEPVRWCITPITASAEKPAPLTEPVLPRGPLVDELGQNALRTWSTQTASVDELSARLKAQVEDVESGRWPADFSRWGGWIEQRFEASGFFRTHHDGRRWWLVDPDGYAFWSAGLDCVRPDTPCACDGLESALAWRPGPAGEFAAAHGQTLDRRTVNYLIANFIRVFGPDAWYDRWAEIALSMLRRFGFNTVANWSDWAIARAAGVPYVRPLSPQLADTPTVCRDFPDVFAASFTADAAAYAEQLRETAGDPALIGYFLMNEPSWGFSSETPAAGMLLNTPRCATRRALADFLRERYGGDDGLRGAWGDGATLEAVADGPWRLPLTAAALADLGAFSERMVEKLFATLTDACRRVDPNHLNLGARYYTVPPEWAQRGMRCFDVFSTNCYQHRVEAELGAVSRTMNAPVIIGEWHFGALDAGPPAAGICTVATQADRAAAYRVYTEDAAAADWCVGVHYFTLYDEGTIGRFDGENWNIGFLDVCNRPYASLADAARASHERVYAVAAGRLAPYDRPPKYLPRHFF